MTRETATVAFATTHWSIVLTAQERSPAADAALEKIVPHLLVAALWIRQATGL